MKAHRRAKARQAYPSSKQAQVYARRPAGSIQIQSPSKLAPHMKGSESIQIAQRMTTIKRPKPI
jgi:hypothetical protein